MAKKMCTITENNSTRGMRLRRKSTHHSHCRLMATGKVSYWALYRNCVKQPNAVTLLDGYGRMRKLQFKPIDYKSCFHYKSVLFCMSQSVSSEHLQKIYVFRNNVKMHFTMQHADIERRYAAAKNNPRMHKHWQRVIHKSNALYLE